MKKTALFALFMLCFFGVAYGVQDIGSVVSLKGSALIEREARRFEAKVKDGIELNDSVETREKSRAKMLFADDSVLTLGEKSKAQIREFLYSREKGGKTVFNLIDGAMRAVVGKAEFEVHTPTAVAAARGTAVDFLTGQSGGSFFTTIICLEGEVIVTSSDPSVPGKVILTAGMSITIWSGKPLPQTEAIRMPGTVIVEVPGFREYVLGASEVPQQPASALTHVDVHAIFK